MDICVVLFHQITGTYAHLLSMEALEIWYGISWVFLSLPHHQRHSTDVRFPKTF